MANLTAHVLEGEQYRMRVDSSTTIGQAADSARAELKRKEPSLDNVSLRSVRHNANGRVREEVMDEGAPMLFVDAADVFQGRQDAEQFRAYVLKRDVISFTSKLAARVKTGVPREGRDYDATGVLQKADNRSKLTNFMQQAGLDGSPDELAEALDSNYDLRNDDVHNTTDKHLKETAEELLRLGAVRLLRDKLPWQCALIEHFALVQERLF